MLKEMKPNETILKLKKTASISQKKAKSRGISSWFTNRLIIAIAVLSSILLL